MIKKEIKDGVNTLLWFDVWKGEVPFCLRFPLLFALETRKGCRVSDRLLMYENEICGRWDWCRQPLGQEEVGELRNLLLECQQVSLVVGSDRVIWSLEEDSGFSIKSLKKIWSIMVAQWIIM